MPNDEHFQKGEGGQPYIFVFATSFFVRIFLLFSVTRGERGVAPITETIFFNLLDFNLRNPLRPKKILLIAEARPLRPPGLNGAFPPKVPLFSLSPGTNLRSSKLIFLFQDHFNISFGFLRFFYTY